MRKKISEHFLWKNLTEYFETVGEKKFRAKQVWEWIWQKHARSFEDMTNLSKELSATISRKFYFTCSYQ